MIDYNSIVFGIVIGFLATIVIYLLYKLIDKWIWMNGEVHSLTHLVRVYNDDFIIAQKRVNIRINNLETKLKELCGDEEKLDDHD